MKNLLTTLRYVPSRFGVVAAVMLATVGAAVTFAWGPDRPTYTMAQPADHVTFNSITDNPNYGDEREFVIIRDLTTGSSYDDVANLVPGHEYQVQVYVHNNAHPDLNASGKGVAKDTNVRVAVPASVTGSDTVDGFVQASNATPAQVWDTAELKSATKVDLEYVSGSAHLSTNSQQVNLPDSILSTGVKIGDKDMSGDWRGCLEYAGAVTFKFRVKTPPTNEFTMDKQVRKHSTTTGGWVETYAAQPGDVVDYIVRYKNTGTTTQENVHVKDVLPTGLTYVAGSTVVANSNYPDGQSVVDGVTVAGINIGAYTPGANAWVRFSAKVAANAQLETCGPNTLKNVASVITGAGTKTDGADVTVTKTCVEPKEIEVCDLTTKKPITIKESEFDATKHSKNLADCKTEVKYVEVCRLDDKQMVRVTESEYNANKAKYSTNPDDCKTLSDNYVKVCRLSDKQEITINEKDFDAAKHSKVLADCKTETTVTPETPKTPETPEVIASTGPEAIIGGLFGSSALGLGISSFVRSRAALRGALNR